MSLTRFDMMLCSCIDFEFSFYYRYRVVWNRIVSPVLPLLIKNDIAKRVHTPGKPSNGDTPGKPKNKAPRLSRKKYPRSSRALFQSPGKSPKVKT